MIRWLAPLLAAVLAAAEPTVSKTWSRGTVAGQETAAIFATITAGSVDDRLIGAETEVAAVIEVHEYTVGPEGMMVMSRMANGLPLRAGATVELRPRSYHIMLIGLHRPLAVGSKLPLTFVFASGARVATEATVLEPWSMGPDDTW